MHNHPVPRILVVVCSGIGMVLLVEIGFAAAQTKPLAVLATLLMVSAAALASGGFLGFLFGVPRMLATRNDAEPGNERDHRQAYAANTNLEQISDWLTKILVGAGLTQLGSIGRELHQLIGAIAPAIAPAPQGAAFAGGALVLFTVGGFALGWLMTRLLLARAMSQADRDATALDLFKKAQAAEASGDTERAAALRGEAVRYLHPDVETLSKRYAEARDLPAGPLRTAQMHEIVATVRQMAKAPEWTGDRVRRLFAAGDAGKRVIALALMQGDLRLADFDCALAAIGAETGFEQFQGLTLARQMLDRLDEIQRQRLRDAIGAGMSTAGRVRIDGSRHAVAKRILDIMDSPEPSAG